MNSSFPLRRPSWTDPRWDEAVAALNELARACRICPRACGADRVARLGHCHAPAELRVASVNLHHGEEPPLSGTRGSGTVFLSWCNLHCRFCQNYPISQQGVGRDATVDALAADLLGLERRGAHNINFVSPTHYSHAVAAAILAARRQGLRVPIVWNSNGYESVEVLRLLEGFVDIYLPDIKYREEEPARRISQAPKYWRVATAAVREMFRQVGRLRTDEDGIGVGGLLIRHLVLPEDQAGTREVLRFIAEELGREIPVSLMSQYFPAHLAAETPRLDRRLTPEEFQRAMDWLDEFGLEEGFVQDEALEGHC